MVFATLIIQSQIFWAIIRSFGLIQALAAANKENDAWEIYNRTPENKANNEIMHIMAPYIIGKQLYKMEPDSEWPGHEWGRTFLRVRCDFKLLQNLLPIETSVRSSIKFDFDTVADRIYEDLGFTYSSLLEDESLEMILVLKHFQGSTREYKVSAIDIFVDDHESKSIIEAKKETASIIDLYQIMMYCDGYYLDHDKMPEEAILVAKHFPEGVLRVVGYLNNKNKGKYPAINCKSWDDYETNFEENLVEEKNR